MTDKTIELDQHRGMTAQKAGLAPARGEGHRDISAGILLSKAGLRVAGFA